MSNLKEELCKMSTADLKKYLGNLLSHMELYNEETSKQIAAAIEILLERNSLDIRRKD